MANFNKVIIVGNLTKDIDANNGSVFVAKSSIAVNRKYKDKNETMFIDFVAFGKTGEMLYQYATKGASIMIEGRLTQNTWEDNNGQKRSKHEIIVETFQLLGRKESATTSHESNSNVANDDDDISF